MALWKLWDRKLQDDLPSASPRSASLPCVGESVELQAGHGEHVGVYQARVRAVGFRRILLETSEALSLTEVDNHSSVPGGYETQSALALPPRTLLTLSYARGEALYFFETRVVGQTKTRALAVVRPHKITKVQRRQFYRLSLESPTIFRVLDNRGRNSSQPLPSRLINLSGGGAMLSSSKPVLSRQPVLVRVPSGKDGDLIDVEGEVLDCTVATRGNARAYLIRVRFYPEQMKDEDREGIIAYIYQQQRMMLRNRKLLRT